MTDLASSSESSPQKRRSTRLVQAIPLMVMGTDALGQPFKERTSTLLISCHGCKYQSKHYVPVGCPVTLEIPRPEAERSPRPVQARVVWVQRPRTIRELFQIGVEFDEPGNIWGIAFPPKDWFPPRDDGREIPAPASESATPAEGKDSRAHGSAAPTPMLAAEDRVRTLPPPASQLPMAMARQMARMLAEAKQHLQNTIQDTAAVAVSEQARTMREQLDAHLRTTAQAAAEAGVTHSLEQTVERAVERALAARLGTQPATAPTPQGPDAEELARQMEAAAQSRLGEWQRELEDVAGPLHRQLQAAVEHATTGAQKTMDALRSALEEERQRAAASLEATQQSVAHAEQSAAQLVAATESKLGEVQQRAEALLAAQHAELERRADSIVAGRGRQLEPALEEAARQFFAHTSGQLEEQLQQQLAPHLQQAQQAAAALASAKEGAEQAFAHASGQFEERLEQQAGAHLQRTRQATIALASAEQRAEALLAAQHAELERHADSIIAGRARQLEPALEEAARRFFARISGQLEEQLQQQLAPHLQQAQQAAAALASAKEGAEQAFAHASGQFEERLEQQAGAHLQRTRQATIALASAEQRAEEVERALRDRLQKAEQSAARLVAATESKMGEAQQRTEALLAAQHAELERRADSIIAGRARQLEPALEGAARQFFARTSGQLEEQLQQQLAPHLQQAQQAAATLASAKEGAEQAFAHASSQFEERLEQQAGAYLQRTRQATIALASAEQRAEQVERALRDRLQKAADEAQQEALERIEQQMAGYPAEFEQACRAVLAKIEEELNAKTTEATQTTFEALYKSSEWYQKKAQTSMQATLERLTEQAGNTLRDRAAEVSRLFASELDSYSRNYAEHTKGLMEESAKEASDRGRNQLSEMVDTAMASFADDVHRVAGGTLDQFEQAARQSVEQSQTVFRAQCGTSLAEVQKRLSDLITEAVAQARQNLQTQLLPVSERFKTQFEGQQRAALDQFAQTSNEAIEQYKTRLENASNSWLLASATTLGQHSQALLETLAQAAETRLRETCAQVFAGFGEALRNRLAGLSAELQPPANPPEKK